MIGDLLKSVIGPILGPLIERIPDPNERARLKAEAEAGLLSAVAAVIMAQIEVNKAEASHSSVFVAGWRPAIGWICGVALGWNFVVQPILMWVAFLFGVDLVKAPKLETAELMTVLLGMLGLGGYRTFEKMNGVARASL